MKYFYNIHYLGDEWTVKDVLALFMENMQRETKGEPVPFDANYVVKVIDNVQFVCKFDFLYSSLNFP
jgi:hypothetical protein